MDTSYSVLEAGLGLVGRRPHNKFEVGSWNFIVEFNFLYIEYFLSLSNSIFEARIFTESLRLNGKFTSKIGRFRTKHLYLTKFINSN